MLLNRIKVLEAAAEEAKQFYGKVAQDGILLFKSVPANDKEYVQENAACMSEKDSWLKLSYPRVQTRAAGKAYWYRAHIVDPTTGEFSYFYVADKTTDGSPCFSLFSTYVENDD